MHKNEGIQRGKRSARRTIRHVCLWACAAAIQRYLFPWNRCSTSISSTGEGDFVIAQRSRSCEDASKTGTRTGSNFKLEVALRADSTANGCHWALDSRQNEALKKRTFRALSGPLGGAGRRRRTRCVCFSGGRSREKPRKDTNAVRKFVRARTACTLERRRHVRLLKPPARISRGERFDGFMTFDDAVLGKCPQGGMTMKRRVRFCGTCGVRCRDEQRRMPKLRKGRLLRVSIRIFRSRPQPFVCICILSHSATLLLYTHQK